MSRRLRIISQLGALCLLLAMLGMSPVRAEMTAYEHLAAEEPYGESALGMGDCLQRFLAMMADSWIMGLQEDRDVADSETPDPHASWVERARYNVDAEDDSVALRMTWDF